MIKINIENFGAITKGEFIIKNGLTVLTGYENTGKKYLLELIEDICSEIYYLTLKKEYNEFYKNHKNMIVDLDYMANILKPNSKQILSNYLIYLSERKLNGKLLSNSDDISILDKAKLSVKIDLGKYFNNNLTQNDYNSIANQIDKNIGNSTYENENIIHLHNGNIKLPISAVSNSTKKIINTTQIIRKQSNYLKNFLIVEYPESYLSPEKQILYINYLSNLSNMGMIVLVFTKSPIIIKQLNNLHLLHNIKLEKEKSWTERRKTLIKNMYENLLKENNIEENMLLPYINIYNLINNTIEHIDEKNSDFINNIWKVYENTEKLNEKLNTLMLQI